jgi:hypothetical protein
MTNDQAYEQLFFEPRSGRQVKENMRDTVWSTWSCTLGFDVMGIWPHDSDGTDINACDRSPSGRYLLTADDFGKVKLFNHPVVVQHAPSLVYPGHSSHVPNVRWSHDETFACSVGGRDRVTLQFRLDRSLPQAPSSSYNYVPIDKEGKIWVDPRSQSPGAYSSPAPQDYDQRGNRAGPPVQRTPQRGAPAAGGGPSQRPASARR